MKFLDILAHNQGAAAMLALFILMVGGIVLVIIHDHQTNPYTAGSRARRRRANTRARSRR